MILRCLENKSDGYSFDVEYPFVEEERRLEV